MKGLVLFISHYGKQPNRSPRQLLNKSRIPVMRPLFQDLRQKPPDLQDVNFVVIRSPNKICKG